MKTKISASTDSKIYSLTLDKFPVNIFDALPSECLKFIRDYEHAIINSENVSIASVCRRNGYKLALISKLAHSNKEFNKIYKYLKSLAVQTELALLDDVSTQSALDPRNTTERIFRLKSLDRETFGDKKALNVSGEISISLGVGISSYDNIASTDTTANNIDLARQSTPVEIESKFKIKKNSKSNRANKKKNDDIFDAINSTLSTL